jgi:hypothetical protein
VNYPALHCSSCGRPFGRVESHLCRYDPSGRLVWRIRKSAARAVAAALDGPRPANVASADNDLDPVTF